MMKRPMTYANGGKMDGGKCVKNRGKGMLLIIFQQGGRWREKRAGNGMRFGLV